MLLAICNLTFGLLFQSFWLYTLLEKSGFEKLDKDLTVLKILEDRQFNYEERLNLLNVKELSELGYKKDQILGEGSIGNAFRHTLWQAMIAKEFEDFLLAHLDNYLIPSDQVAIFIDSHNADHVVLLLTSNGYSRVPVLTKDKHYLGTISLTDIKRYQDEHNLQEWEMVNRDIGPMTSDVVETVEDNANLNEVMHKLVDNPFLPVVDSQGIFKGIITRKSILKAVNSLLHDFTHDYIIIPKTTDNSDY
mgnify:CR=1 FL=1